MSLLLLGSFDTLVREPGALTPIQAPALGARRRSTGGFSLVEVALAMGVMGFAFVSLIGMLTLGLTTFKQASGNTIESQIIQNLSNDILLSNFSNLSTYNGQTYYFDNEGTELTSTGTSAPANALYAVAVSLNIVDGSNTPAALALNSSIASASALNVTLTITSVSDNTTYTQQHPHKYSMIVANNGR